MNQPDPTPAPNPDPGAAFVPRQRRGRHRRPDSTAPLGPVPLSVWLTEPLTGCCPRCDRPAETACAQRLPADLARQLVEAFTKPGDIVFVPDAGNALAVAAACQARRKTLAIAAHPAHARRVQQQLAEHAPGAEALAILRTAAGPEQLLAQADRIGERAALALLAPHTPTSTTELAGLLASAHRALPPGGTAVICSRQNPAQDTLGLHVAYAQAAGFVYLQHIAAVEARAEGTELVPHERRDDHGPDCACENPRPAAAARRVVHFDVLVLHRP